MIEKLSEEEAKKINEIRNNVPQLKSGQFTDGFLLRWLRASNRDVKQTEIALKRHMSYRKAWQLDQLVNVQMPEVCRKYYAYGYPGKDREGYPVLLSLFGLLDVEGLMKSVSSVDYIKTSLKHVEEGLKLAEQAAKEKGDPYGQMMMVVDLEGLSTSHYSYKPFTYSYLTLLTIFQENYPLAFKKIVVIRAPSMAQYAYTLLQPVLSENLQNLIEMLSDSWKDKLFELIDPSQWPVHWGGKMKDSDGNEKCPSKILCPEGPIPESSYIHDEMADAEAVTVYAGDKHFVYLETEKEDCEIWWKFRTSGEDIGFSISYDPTGDRKTDLEQIFPYIRLECSIVPIEDSVKCEKKGKYVVEFDNYYSWFSSKDLKYSAKVLG